ncbi:MAG: hypothetical protein NTZ13_02315 [Candidatus Parcubacteria bacterium]|nr:hypothetical protein [Candidatus Parcubacteria bacterium]
MGYIGKEKIIVLSAAMFGLFTFGCIASSIIVAGYITYRLVPYV